MLSPEKLFSLMFSFFACNKSFFSVRLILRAAPWFQDTSCCTVSKDVICHNMIIQFAAFSHLRLGSCTWCFDLV